ASATVASNNAPTVTVSNIALAGGSLALRYTSSVQGTPYPSLMTLTPQGDVLRAKLSVSDGQYEMNGMAAKQSPAAEQQAGRGGRGAGGFGNRAMTNENTDFSPKPPYVPRRPDAEARGFILPAG